MLSSEIKDLVWGRKIGYVPGGMDSTMLFLDDLGMRRSVHLQVYSSPRCNLVWDALDIYKATNTYCYIYHVSYVHNVFLTLFIFTYYNIVHFEQDFKLERQRCIEKSVIQLTESVRTPNLILVAGHILSFHWTSILHQGE